MYQLVLLCDVDDDFDVVDVEDDEAGGVFGGDGEDDDDNCLCDVSNDVKRLNFTILIKYALNSNLS